MAKHSDIRKLPVKRKDIPNIQVNKNTKFNKWAKINTVLIIGIYVLLLKDWWLSFLIK